MPKDTDVAKKLTDEEVTQWEELKSLVTNGMATVIDVGVALHEIRMRRLYRDEFETFDGYCESIDTSRQRVSQLIQAGRAQRMLTANGITIENESQARALLRVPPKEMPKVWREAGSSGRVTTAKINEVIASRHPVKPETPPLVTEDGQPAYTDEVGNILEDDTVIEAFKKANLFDDAIKDIKGVRDDVRGMQSEPHGAFIHQKDLEAAFNTLLNVIHFAKPFALCPFCGNAGGEGCKACRCEGWVPKLVYKAAPAETKRAEPKPATNMDEQADLEEF